MESVYLFQHKRLIEIEPQTGEKVYDTKILGFCSTEEKCKELIPFYLQLEGFRDYPDDFFIEEVKADIDGFNDAPGEFGKYVYYLSHEYYDGEYDNITDIGYYLTQQKAEETIRNYKSEPEFLLYPDGFEIGRYEIDQTYWKYGFSEK